MAARTLTMSSGWMTQVAPMPDRPPLTNGFSVCHVLLSAISEASARRSVSLSVSTCATQPQATHLEGKGETRWRRRQAGPYRQTRKIRYSAPLPSRAMFSCASGGTEVFTANVTVLRLDVRPCTLRRTRVAPPQSSTAAPAACARDAPPRRCSTDENLAAQADALQREDAVYVQVRNVSLTGLSARGDPCLAQTLRSGRRHWRDAGLAPHLPRAGGRCAPAVRCRSLLAQYTPWVPSRLRSPPAAAFTRCAAGFGGERRSRLLPRAESGCFSALGGVC